MKTEFEVIITRTFVQHATVYVDAEDEVQAQLLAEQNYYNGEYDAEFTDMDDYSEINFEAEEYGA